MFEAYSCKLKKSVTTTEVTDLHDTFKCLNPECNAEYTLRSINGKKSAYFGRKPSTPHVKNCPYDIEANRYIDSEDMVKSDIYKIYNHEKSISQTAEHIKSQTSNKAIKSIKRISTPKQLLNYCISNRLNTVYTNNVTVGDIILDSRNILQNNNYKGISGLKLLLGKTIRFNQSENAVYFDVSSVAKNQQRYYLTATVYLNPYQFDEIVNYILNTFKLFANHQIAVLGEWEIKEIYKVQCVVNNPSNVIYKFAHEK